MARPMPEVPPMTTASLAFKTENRARHRAFRRPGCRPANAPFLPKKRERCAGRKGFPSRSSQSRLLLSVEQVEIAPPHLGCDLEADMQQLAKAAVINRRSRNVAQGRGILL